MVIRGAQLCTRCRAEVRGGPRCRASDPEVGAWISKHAAITLIWQAQATRERTVGSRQSAAYQLGEWRRAARVRTKADPSSRRDYHKHDPVLYRRADVERQIGRLAVSTAKRPDGYDPELDALLKAAATSRKRRFELGIATLGPPVEYPWM
jgi:hypothetical protein